jgi:hypothetical protein
MQIAAMTMSREWEFHGTQTLTMITISNPRERYYYDYYYYTPNCSELCVVCSDYDYECVVCGSERRRRGASVDTSGEKMETNNHHNNIRDTV